MTDLEKKIDQDLGNDTEHARVTYLKYLNLGRQLESEQRATNGQFSAAEVEAKVKLTVQGVLTQVKAILKEANDQAMQVEKVDEDEAFEKMRTTPPADLASAFAGFGEILSTCDQKHTLITKTRDERLSALDALWA